LEQVRCAVVAGPSRDRGTVVIGGRMSLRGHWERVYAKTAIDQVSWFQLEATVSLDLVIRYSRPSSAVLDVGGGASTLVDGLLAQGYQRVTVLDFARAALHSARARLGAGSTRARWIAADALEPPFRDGCFDLWHDRALFHFLTDQADRARYLSQLSRLLRPGGVVVLATFAADGPTRCSGREIVRYSVEALHAALGDRFEPLAAADDQHRTPDGRVQHFQYGVFGLRARPTG